jgi:hypothetical protein
MNNSTIQEEILGWGRNISKSNQSSSFCFHKAHTCK